MDELASHHQQNVEAEAQHQLSDPVGGKRVRQDHPKGPSAQRKCQPLRPADSRKGLDRINQENGVAEIREIAQYDGYNALNDELIDADDANHCIGQTDNQHDDWEVGEVVDLVPGDEDDDGEGGEGRGGVHDGASQVFIGELVQRYLRESVVEEECEHEEDAHQQLRPQLVVAQHVADSDLVVIVLQPRALGEVDGYRSQFVDFGDVVDDVVGHQLVSLVGVDS